MPATPKARCWRPQPCQPARQSCGITVRRLAFLPVIRSQPTLEQAATAVLRRVEGDRANYPPASIHPALTGRLPGARLPVRLLAECTTICACAASSLTAAVAQPQVGARQRPARSATGHRRSVASRRELDHSATFPFCGCTHSAATTPPAVLSLKLSPLLALSNCIALRKPGFVALPPVWCCCCHFAGLIHHHRTSGRPSSSYRPAGGDQHA